jgi:hypothetical protein
MITMMRYGNVLQCVAHQHCPCPQTAESSVFRSFNSNLQGKLPVQFDVKFIIYHNDDEVGRSFLPVINTVFKLGAKAENKQGAVTRRLDRGKIYLKY